MKIKFLSVGKIKEKYLIDGILEYSKRLSKYCKVEHIEVADERTPQFASFNEIEKITEIEANRLLNKISDKDFVISLCIEGSSLSSVELSKKIEQITTSGFSDICFVIGGSLGLNSLVTNRANFKLSFSKMTFPHQLMKLILTEQVYRSFRIINNEPYHK